MLASLVKFSSHLEELFVDDNLIGNEGVEFLAEAVVCCRTLRLLSLSHNNISEPGVDALCHSLVHNMALKDLRLLHNPLGPDGVKHIGELLARNKCLTSLDISDVDLMREESNLGIQVRDQRPPPHCTSYINQLHVIHCTAYINPRCSENLIIIQSNTIKLIKINLQAINFGLTRNRQLRHLKMRSNKIDDQVKSTLLSALCLHILLLSHYHSYINPLIFCQPLPFYPTLSTCYRAYNPQSHLTPLKVLRATGLHTHNPPSHTAPSHIPHTHIHPPLAVLWATGLHTHNPPSYNPPVINLTHPLQSCGQLAFALLDNKGLIELDLSFNILRDRWFKVTNHYP